MPTKMPFFLDAPTLQQATTAYLDNGFANVAPDGLYSDGTIVRRLSNGQFITLEQIPPCNPPCNPPMPIQTGASNIYDMSIHTGKNSTDIGAIVIKFTFELGGDGYYTGGVEAELNGVEYTKLVSDMDGLVELSPSAPVGTIPFIYYPSGIACFDNPTTSFFGDIFDYNGYEFNTSGYSLTYDVDYNNVNFYIDDPGSFFMVVPKTTPNPEMLNIRVYIPCADGICKIEASCPIILPSFICSDKFDDWDVPEYCPSPLDNTLYYVKTRNDEGGGVLENNTMVFTDSFGQTPAPDGYYKVPNFITPGGGYDTIQVVDGIIGSLLSQC